MNTADDILEQIESHLREFDVVTDKTVQWVWLGGWNPMKNDQECRIAIKNLELERKNIHECYGVPIWETTKSEWGASHQAGFRGFVKAYMKRQLLAFAVAENNQVRIILWDCNCLTIVHEWLIPEVYSKIKEKLSRVFKSGCDERAMIRKRFKKMGLY